MKRATGSIRMGGKLMNKKLLKLEQKIVKEIATPKYKYLKVGTKLSIHLDKRVVITCTEGYYHDTVRYPRKIRILWLGKKKTWIKLIPLERVQ